MSEQFWVGVILAALAGIALISGVASGEMPIGPASLDTSRSAAPAWFWAGAVFYGFVLAVGVALAARAASGA